MRFLLHSEDADYDADTKIYTFTLEKRIDRPRTLRVQKAHFSNATNTTHPLIVYLRSTALCKLITRKHTLRCRASGHENGENILATLGETHSTGRYTLENDTRVFKTDPHMVVKQIDISFSDNATLLAKGAQSSTTSSSTTSGEDHLDELHTLGKLLIRLDPSDTSTTLSDSYMPVTGLSEDIRVWTNQANAPSSFAMIGNSRDFERIQFGDYAHALQAADSWLSFSDPQEPTPWPEGEFHLCFMFRAPFSSTTCDVIWTTRNTKVRISGNELTYTGLDGSSSVWVTIGTLNPGHAYLFSMARVDTAGGTINTSLENLTLETAPEVMTGGYDINWHSSMETGWNWTIGGAQFGVPFQMSNLILCLDSSTDSVTTVKAYLKAKYTGEVVAENSGEATVAQVEDSKFFIELAIDMA